MLPAPIQMEMMTCARCDTAAVSTLLLHVLYVKTAPYLYKDTMLPSVTQCYLVVPLPDITVPEYSASVSHILCHYDAIISRLVLSTT